MSKKKRVRSNYGGFEIDVPDECFRFPSYWNRYYQITGIAEYSRKRVVKIVKDI